MSESNNEKIKPEPKPEYEPESDYDSDYDEDAELNQNFAYGGDEPAKSQKGKLPGWGVALLVFVLLIVVAAIVIGIFYISQPGEDSRQLLSESLSTEDETEYGPSVWITDCNGFYIEDPAAVGGSLFADQSQIAPPNTGWTFIRQSTFINDYALEMTGDADAQVQKYPNADEFAMTCWIRNSNNQWIAEGDQITFIPVMTICDENDSEDCLSMSNGFSFESFGFFDGNQLQLSTQEGQQVMISRDANAARTDTDQTQGLYRVLCYDTSASRWKIWTYYIPDSSESDPYPIAQGQDLNASAESVLDWATTDNATYGVPGDVSGYTTTLANPSFKWPIILSDTKPTNAPFRIYPVGIHTFFWIQNSGNFLGIQNDLATFQEISVVDASPLIWLVQPIDDDTNVVLYDGQYRYKDSFFSDIGIFKPYDASTLE